jgi:hypothetical protein
MLNQDQVKELVNLVETVSAKREKDGADYVNSNLLREEFSGKIEIVDYKQETVENRASDKQGAKTVDIKLTIKINGSERKGWASQLANGYINDDNEFVGNAMTWKQIVKAICENKTVTVEEKKWFGGKPSAADGECPNGYFDYVSKKGKNRYKVGKTYVVTELN